MRLTVLASLALYCAGQCACSSPEPQPVQPAAPHASPSAAPSAPAAPGPTGTPVSPSAAPSSAEAAGGLTWQGRPPLVRRTPKSRMRAAEYGLEGDAQSELSVFYFGPDQGGSVDANIARWLGQLTQADGSDTAKKSKREQQTFGSVAVTTIEATGNFGGGMAMPGMPAPSAIPDAMLLGAIATGPAGPVFFKLVGPRSAVEGARDAFRALLESLRVDSAPSP